MDNETKTLFEGLKELFNTKFEALYNKIDEMKDDHKEKLEKLEKRIEDIEIKNQCQDDDINKLKTKPAEEAQDYFKIIKVKIVETIPYLILAAFVLWANNGFRLP